jgi:hypothetical protein
MLLLNRCWMAAAAGRAAGRLPGAGRQAAAARGSLRIPNLPLHTPSTALLPGASSEADSSPTYLPSSHHPSPKYLLPSAVARRARCLPGACL